MDVVNLEERLSRFDETWSPRIVGRLNGQLVKVARLAGEFVWHHHAEEDELFLVIAGRLRMKFRDGERLIAPGEFIIVPRGVEHRPVAESEVEVMLFEPANVRNTGNIIDDKFTAPAPERP